MNVNLYELAVLEKALELELKGLKSRGRTAYSIIKSEFGFKGGRESVLSQFKDYRQNLMKEVLHEPEG